jgi:hypothetical protein
VAQVPGGVRGRCKIFAVRSARLLTPGRLLTPVGRRDRLCGAGTGRVLLAVPLRGRLLTAVDGRHRLAAARGLNGGAVLSGVWFRGARPRRLVRTRCALRGRGPGICGTPDHRASDTALRLPVTTTARLGAGR